jgi:hypothetical protein
MHYGYLFTHSMSIYANALIGATIITSSIVVQPWRQAAIALAAPTCSSLQDHTQRGESEMIPSRFFYSF